MHRVASTGNTSSLSRPRKERRLTYLIPSANSFKHCSGVNSIIVDSTPNENCNENEFNCDYFLFSASRDGTIKRWSSNDRGMDFSATFESHVDWVNDIIFVGKDTLVSCSSDTTIKVWKAYSDGECMNTIRQHKDYVTSLTTCKGKNIFASSGLSNEVFLWDVEYSNSPIATIGSVSTRTSATGSENGLTRDPAYSSPLHTPIPSPSPLSFTPKLLEGHKESIYSLAMNESGSVLVSGGTEKVIRVWDPRSASKQMKLKGHTDNIRTLLLDASGRLCLSGSSDSMIRLWDLGQQRCIHSYAVHSDSVWTLSANHSFSTVFSAGRDRSIYETDLSTRESVLIAMEKQPVLRMAYMEEEDCVWAATTSSSLHKWSTKRQKGEKGGEGEGQKSSFISGSLSLVRARSMHSSPKELVPLRSKPVQSIEGIAGIVKHNILNDRRHVLTQDSDGRLKKWEITRGAIVQDYGASVPFEEKEKELFEPVNVLPWFTMDTRLGSIAVHLDSPQCFSAEVYALDLNVQNAPDDQKLNLGQETLKGLFAHWAAKQQRQQHVGSDSNTKLTDRSGNQHDNSDHDPTANQTSVDLSHKILPEFDFSSSPVPSIISEGSKGEIWRKKVVELNTEEDAKEIPAWCIDCILFNRLPPRESPKCSFMLVPYSNSNLPALGKDKLNAPRILKINKVMNHVLERLGLNNEDANDMEENKEADASRSSNAAMAVEQAQGNGRPKISSNSSQKEKVEIEIVCNEKVVSPEMSLASARTFIWKKPEDLVLEYRVATTN